jgi:hypothetical protein
MPAEPPGPTPQPSQATLVWAVRLLAAEAAALFLLVIFLAYEGLTAAAGSAPGALAVTLYAALMAALMGGLGWMLWRRRAWARGPAIVLQLLLVPIGYTIVSGGLWWLGLVVMAVGLCGAGTLLAPATRASLGMK